MQLDNYMKYKLCMEIKCYNSFLTIITEPVPAVAAVLVIAVRPAVMPQIHNNGKLVTYRKLGTK
jgi:hypothetical protein